MLKTNSKKAKENIMNYIKQAADYISTEYSEEYTHNLDLSIDKNLCLVIWDIFKAEKKYSMEYIKAHRLTYYDLFEEWASGLALNLFDYYYNVSAIDLLGEILEESDQEKAHFTESEAEKKLTYLIYRTITSNIENF